MTTEFRTGGWIPYCGTIEVFLSLHECYELNLDPLQKHYMLIIPVEPSIPTSHIFCTALTMNMYECHIHSNLNTLHVIVIGLSQVLYCKGRGLLLLTFLNS